MTFLEVLGWIGTVLYLLNHGYISVTTDWNKEIYYSGNAIAALLLVISSLAIGSWQAVIINSFWAIVSVRSLLGSGTSNKMITHQQFGVVLLIILLAAFLSIFIAPEATISILGWSSVWVFCISYLLFTSGDILPRYYFLYSAYAATVLLPQLWADSNMAVFYLEIVWAVLSLYAAKKRFSQAHIID